MTKALKYLTGITTVLLVLYFSVDIKNLDEYRFLNRAETFNASEYANDVWKNKIPEVAGKAPEMNLVIDLFENNPEKAFSEYGKKLGISKTWYFMVQSSGTIDSVDNESVWVSLENNRRIQLATAFIFGNAVREGSGAVNIDDFINMTDFNNVSVALNKKVKTDIIPVLKKNSITGRKVEFSGVFEMNEEKIDLKAIRIIPVSIHFENAE